MEEKNVLWQAYINAARAVIEGKLKFENFKFCSPAEQKQVDADSEHVLTYLPFRPVTHPLFWEDTEQNLKKLITGTGVQILVNLKMFIGAIDDYLKWPADIKNIPHLIEFMSHPRTKPHGYRIYANALAMLRGIEPKNEKELETLANAKKQLHTALTALKTPITPDALYYLQREDIDIKPRLGWLIEGQDYSRYMDEFRPNDENSHKIALYLLENGFIKDLEYVRYYISHFTPAMLTDEWQQAIASLGFQNCAAKEEDVCAVCKVLTPELAVQTLVALLQNSYVEENPEEIIFTPAPLVIETLAEMLKKAKKPELCEYVCENLSAENELIKICVSGCADKLVAEILAIPPRNFDSFDGYFRFCPVVLSVLDENLTAETLRRCLKNLSRWPKDWRKRYEFIMLKQNLKQLALPVLEDKFFTNKDGKDYILFYTDSLNSNEWKDGLKMILSSQIDGARKHQAIAYLATRHAETAPTFLDEDERTMLSQFKVSLPETWQTML